MRIDLCWPPTDPRVLSLYSDPRVYPQNDILLCDASLVANRLQIYKDRILLRGLYAMAPEHDDDDDALWLEWRKQYIKTISDEISAREAYVTANLARQVQVNLDEYPTSASSPPGQQSPRLNLGSCTPDFTLYVDIDDGSLASSPSSFNISSLSTSSSSVAAATQSSNLQSHGPLRQVQFQTSPAKPENLLDRRKSSKKTPNRKARGARDKEG